MKVYNSRNPGGVTYSPKQNTIITIIGSVLTILITPFWPLVILLFAIAMYFTWSSADGTWLNPIKVLAASMGIFRAMGLREYYAFQIRSGEPWERRAKFWSKTAEPYCRFIFMASVYVALVITSFCSDKITKDTTAEELHDLYFS